MSDTSSLSDPPSSDDLNSTNQEQNDDQLGRSIWEDGPKRCEIIFGLRTKPGNYNTYVEFLGWSEEEASYFRKSFVRPWLESHPHFDEWVERPQKTPGLPSIDLWHSLTGHHGNLFRDEFSAADRERVRSRMAQLRTSQDSNSEDEFQGVSTTEVLLAVVYKTMIKLINVRRYYLKRTKAPPESVTTIAKQKIPDSEVVEAATALLSLKRDSWS